MILSSIWYFIHEFKSTVTLVKYNLQLVILVRNEQYVAFSEIKIFVRHLW